MMDVIVGSAMTLLDKNKENDSSKYDYVIEPDEPILTEAALINEVINWAMSAGKKVDIHSTSRHSIDATIDNKNYSIKLEKPKDDTFMANRGMITYKCIYMYENK